MAAQHVYAAKTRVNFISSKQ